MDEATFVPLPAVNTNVPLVEFSSPDKGYSVSYPEGWEADTSPGVGTDMFLWEVDGRRVALLQVTCNPQLFTADDLMSADASIASRFGGILDSAAAVPVEVGGLEGKRNTYALGLGGLRVEHVVVYLSGEECGWRIGLSTFGGGTRDEFLPLFDRIIETFQPD